MPIKNTTTAALNLSIVKRYFFLGVVATPPVFVAFLSPIVADSSQFKAA
jgi:hypothetical protein